TQLSVKLCLKPWRRGYQEGQQGSNTFVVAERCKHALNSPKRDGGKEIREIDAHDHGLIGVAPRVLDNRVTQPKARRCLVDGSSRQNGIVHPSLSCAKLLLGSRNYANASCPLRNREAVVMIDRLNTSVIGQPGESSRLDSKGLRNI